MREERQVDLIYSKCSLVAAVTDVTRGLSQDSSQLLVVIPQ